MIISSVTPVNYSTTIRLNYKINVYGTYIYFHPLLLICCSSFSYCRFCFCSDTTYYILGNQVHNARIICNFSKWLMSFLPCVCPDDTEIRPPHLTITIENETANHIWRCLLHWHKYNTVPTWTSVQVMLSVQKVQTWEGETCLDRQISRLRYFIDPNLENYSVTAAIKAVKSTI